MRGKILLTILELLKESAWDHVDLNKAILVSGYGASSGKINYQIKKYKIARENKKFEDEELKNKKRKAAVFLAKIKKDGLLCEKTEKGGTKFFLSDKGKIKLAQLKNQLPSADYQINKQNNLVVISFDIPEDLRKKRNWLREVIKNIGFKMAHKSVWFGKIKIPEEFIKDMENMNLLDYVKIFEINKTGNLEEC